MKRLYIVCRLAILFIMPLFFSARVWSGELPHHSKRTFDKRDTVRAVVDTSKMSWWNKARFGMFIHWGVYSVLGGVYEGTEEKSLGEWIMQHQKIPVQKYKAYAKLFNPVKYDPEQWVLMAQKAGMKYIVITTKHHDGFALFDSKASDWNVVKATPYGKDLIRPLADACRKYGMKLGFYYSQANDWNNPGGAAKGGHWDKDQDGSMDEYIDKVAVPQVREILNNYGDVAELWWDVPTDMNKERAAKFIPLLAPHPRVITNDRLGGEVAGDLATPEQYIPATGIPGRYWEACMTMNNTWGYKTNDHNWKSGKQLIRTLIETTSKGGNYLLNVGPKPSGEFPDEIVQLLTQIGAWMKVNSESIYGTSPGPFKLLSWGKCTAKEEAGNTALYLHVFNWPADKKILLPGLTNTIISTQLLANGSKLPVTKSVEGWLIQLPENPVDTNATVIKMIVKGKAEPISYIQTADQDGAFTLPAVLADLHSINNSKPVVISVEGRNEPYLGAWTDPASWVSWQFRADRKGKYIIEATTSSPVTVSSTVQINVAGQTLKAEVTGTGNKSTYQKNNLGEFTIDKPGVQQLSIRPEAGAWNILNIRNIRIVPKND